MIAAFRTEVADMLRAQNLVPVHEFIPDDVAELPCLVVGAVEMTPGDVRSTWDLDLDIYLLGRRYNDDDSQSELDNHADHLASILLLGRFPALQRLYPPPPIQVAGQPVPAYIAAVRTTRTGPC